jgi:hypothetical protein
MDMAKVIINVKIMNPSGLVIEVPEMTVENLKELIGTNGHISAGANVHRATSGPDYDGLKKSLSENARKFLRILRDNPSGINADNLAEKLGFKSGTQIGGMTGGGISKNANKFHVELTDIYAIEVSQQNGQRVTTYKPGKEIAKLQ